MQRDYLGNPLTGRREATLHSIDDFIEGYLAYEARAEHILLAADADPGSCMANVYAGTLWMLLEAPEAPVRAAKYLSAAESAAPSASRREQLNTAMLRAWADDDVERAIRLCDQVSDEFPRDLAIVKTHQYLEFNRGNAPAMLRVALKVAAANADVPYVYGMKAFGYEQCHLLEEAESEARSALAMRRKEPWAQHALAHVFLTRGRIDEGAQFLEDASDTWSGLNSFMVTHIWWHLALFYLSQGRVAEALDAYDEHCWGVAKDYSQDQVGAISLLARLELAGVDVGSRWQDLADHLAARAKDTIQPFLTLQYLYGLARARRPQAEALLGAVRNQAHNAPEFTRTVWREVALPACEGLYSYACGEYQRAWHQLSMAMPRMAEAGGSHAQRDLFAQFLLDAALKSGRLTAAQHMLELRRGSDPNGVPVNAALAALYDELGLAGLADQARSRAALTRVRHAGKDT
ncbi:MAG TPA: tetratricopeptide repeat protein [Steroidobacteraceae bacterium]|jgi:tetratricopeptide (TPR) repeat protein